MMLDSFGLIWLKGRKELENYLRRRDAGDSKSTEEVGRIATIEDSRKQESSINERNGEFIE